MPTTSNHATILITDASFLVPTLVSALQIHNKYKELTDVIVYLVEIDNDLSQTLSETFKDIKFVLLDDERYKPDSNSYHRDNHVPVCALARLIIYDYIPETYDDILYIDGDTLIVGDITPLIKYRVPEGRVAAVNSTYWLKNIEQDQRLADYMTAINRRDDIMTYFNSGILAFQRETWKDVSAAALEFTKRYDTRVLHHDQSALNAVLKGNIVSLPPAYNFHKGYYELGVQIGHTPKIVHFSGPNKPWLYTMYPWHYKHIDPYIDILTKHPFLCDYMKMPKKPSLPRYIYRSYREYLKNTNYIKTVFDMVKKRKRVLNYIKSTDFPIS